jgi:hypothetical protein
MFVLSHNGQAFHQDITSDHITCVPEIHKTKNKEVAACINPAGPTNQTFEDENMIRTSTLSAEANLTSDPVAMTIFTESVQLGLNYHGVKLAHEGSHCNTSVIVIHQRDHLF